MNDDRRIRTIAVVGGGIVGFSAAIAFARALPGTRVTLIETAPDPAALADIVPVAWPGVTRFHAALGIDEIELVRSGAATHHLGTIFESWSASGEPWIHAFGDYGKPVGAIPFDQLWGRARRAAEAEAFDRYSVGAALAREGKFVHPAKDPKSLGSRYRYGLRLDPDAYRERLRSQAAAAKVVPIAGDVQEVQRRGDRIDGLALADGISIDADLFVDCTGPAARLISAVDDSFEDWKQWMPFDRLQLHDAAGEPVPPTADRVRAADDSWSVEWPLRGRTLHAELRVGGKGTALTRGRRLRPWVGNVLALGDAATALDPLHGMNLDLAQQAILLALELLPGRDFNSVETAEYNRRAELITRRVRDFIALHYLGSGRTDGVWAELSKGDRPDSLARTIDQYRYRGRLPFHEEESVTRDGWAAALVGLGVVPANDDPQAAAVPLEQVVPAMRRLAIEIDQSVASVPSYAHYLATMVR